MNLKFPLQLWSTFLGTCLLQVFFFVTLNMADWLSSWVSAMPVTKWCAWIFVTSCDKALQYLGSSHWKQFTKHGTNLNFNLCLCQLTNLLIENSKFWTSSHIFIRYNYMFRHLSSEMTQACSRTTPHLLKIYWGSLKSWTHEWQGLFWINITPQKKTACPR